MPEPRNRVEKLLEPLVGPLLDRLARAGLSPDFVTLLSLALTLPAAGLIAWGRPAAGCLLAAFATSLDWVDGQVARRSGRVSQAGNFLDSTLDRWGDLALYGGAAVLFRGSLPLLVASLLLLGSAFLVSYARAKAESLGVELTVGAMQRAERLAVFCAAGFAGPVADPWVAPWLSTLAFEAPEHATLAAAVVLLAVATTATAVRRTVMGFRAVGDSQR